MNGACFVQLYFDDGNIPYSFCLTPHSFYSECFLCAKLCVTARDTDMNQIQSNISQIQAYFILLSFPLLCFRDIVFFYKLKVCGNTVFEQVHQNHCCWKQQHLLTSCLCHILVILTILQTFSLSLYLLCDL